MTRKADGGGERGTVKFRIVEFELAGNDATLQESLRSITAAINRAADGAAIALPSQPRQPRQLTPTGAAVPAAPKNGRRQQGETTATGMSADDTDGDENDAGAIDDDEAEAREASVGAASGASRAQYHTPKVLEIDIESGTGLKAYLAGRHLDTHNDKYLAIAAWFQMHREIPAVGVGQIYTCYKLNGWTPPSDASMPLRRMVSKGFQWFEKAGRGKYRINQVGMSKVPPATNGNDEQQE